MALVGLAFLLFGWILVFILPTIRFFAWIILGIGAILVVVGAILDFRRMRTALASGRGRFGVGTSLAVSLVIGIVLIANAISVNWHHRFDFTGLERFTLTSQTKKVLKELDTEIDVVTMFTPAVDVAVSGYARELLAEYETYTTEITIRHVDPDLEPDVARRYGLSQVGAQYGVVIFRGPKGERRVYGTRISTEAEHAFTSAILEVTGAEQKKVYFVTGHGEASPAEVYFEAREGLLDNLFSVGDLDVERTRAPEDASALVIAGPRKDLTQVEIQHISEYLVRGGSVMVLLDPNPPASFRDFVSRFWLRIDDGILIDPASFVAPFRDSPLIPPERNNFPVGDTFFSGATAILPTDDRPDGVNAAPIAWTSNQSWLEKGNESPDVATYDEGVDLEGPLAIGVLLDIPIGGSSPSDSSSGGPKSTRLVVFGDSDFISNRNFRNGGNSTLFLSTANWLTANDQIISIDRKVLTTRRLLLDPEQARFLHLSSIGLLPFLLLLAAAYVWWWRRQ